MKRIIVLSVLAVLCAACVKGPSSLSVSPSDVEIPAYGGSSNEIVRCDGDWSLEISQEGNWCKASMIRGSGSATISLSAESNIGGDLREATIGITAGSLSPAIVRVVQKGEGTVPAEIVYPDPASGISVEPEVPDADGECTIRFRPQAGNPLYNHSGELYGHLGVVVEGEWMFVPCEWAVSDEKVHFKKNGDNDWELKLTPSIREYFGSGETPVNMIAIIVRSEDGNIKSHDNDQFCSVTDNKYQPEQFDPDPVVKETMPADAHYGINTKPDGSVTFVLYDRDTRGNCHKYCYIVGDWNGWERVSEAAMKRDEASGCWWISLSGFDPDKEYRFQYRLGTQSGTDVRISDPYTEIVYDQWNDKYISWAPEFPEDARALVSAFKINRDEYNWQVEDFRIEDRKDLVIYEMHLRDFSPSGDLAGALERLDYISDLGVNAVELMPVQEFDGNDSWGYNPNHWFALDKAYGTREQYKQFIDECHKRGIAVLFDVVYNHTTGSHSWAKMWWDSSLSCTAENNPWFNMYPTHPYNVYHDLNHENQMVRQTVKESLGYLLEEYRVDGFRFDLTKGFTQTQTDPDVAKWGKYDQSRVDILEDYADYIHSVNPDAAVIFEHLSDWDEEKVLAEHDIQLWRNVNGEFRNAMSGSGGNFSNIWSTAPFGGFVGYMESHDEERICYGATASADDVSWGICGTLTGWGSDADIAMGSDGPFYVAKNVSFTATDMFKIRGNSEWNDAYNWGASSKGFKLPLDKGYEMTLGSSSQDMAVPAAGSYDIYFCPDAATVWLMTPGKRPEEPETGSDDDVLALAMRRAGACAAFFLTVPGPKMIWQFGEIGYDYSINYNDRTGRKPVVTDKYMSQKERRELYDTYSKLLRFRRDNPRFFDQDAKFSWTPSGTKKTILCSVDGKSFHVVGNFGKQDISHTLPAGDWKDWQSGETPESTISLKPGQFRLFIDF